jgi:hypothetical protein
MLLIKENPLHYKRYRRRQLPVNSRKDAAYQRESTPLQEIETLGAEPVKVPVSSRNDAAYQGESTLLQEVEIKTKEKLVAIKESTSIYHYLALCKYQG